ncbi:hypothetical protein B0T17DRAFT_616498 [Bombardia bombarda]|uniref:Uncharacterized protein n=1 Tax=Bombardia bombarda TaxID=252184 RepID=A0AA40CA96_9PEZI|nr:hypothetical protein B0T17DRAFT_616498 [Bombardia bombarda]
MWGWHPSFIAHPQLDDEDRRTQAFNTGKIDKKISAVDDILRRFHESLTDIETIHQTSIDRLQANVETLMKDFKTIQNDVRELKIDFRHELRRDMAKLKDDNMPKLENSVEMLIHKLEDLNAYLTAMVSGKDARISDENSDE